MLISDTTSYRELYFEPKILTTINSKLTFSALHKLLLELNKNTVFIPSILGGGLYEFVVIILSPPIYATLVLLTPFVIPQHPGPVPQIYSVAQYEIALAKIIHYKGLNTFHSFQLVQRVLVQKMLEAIDTKYIISLCN